MENLITRNTKFASIEEVVQLVENHKMAGAIVIGIGAMAYVLDKNLKDFLHDFIPASLSERRHTSYQIESIKAST